MPLHGLRKFESFTLKGTVDRRQLVLILALTSTLEGIHGSNGIFMARLTLFMVPWLPYKWVWSCDHLKSQLGTFPYLELSAALVLIRDPIRPMARSDEYGQSGPIWSGVVKHYSINNE